MASYEYVGKAEREPQIRSIWCHQCEDIRQGVLPYLKMHTTLKREDAISSIKFLKHSTFYRFSTQKKKQVHDQQQIIIEEEKVMQARVDYFKSSRFEPKCLSCGSHNIQKLKPFTSYMDHYFANSMSDISPERMGIIHSCGGEIEANIQARYIFGKSYTPPVIEFNEDGAIINNTHE